LKIEKDYNKGDLDVEEKVSIFRFDFDLGTWCL
jgi:hypothetical protein